MGGLLALALYSESCAGAQSALDNAREVPLRARLSVLRIERIEQTRAGAVHILHIASHERQVVHDRRRREKTVDCRDGGGDVQAPPELRDALIDGQQTLGVVVDQPSEPAIEVLGLGGIAQAHAFDTLAQLTGHEHGEEQIGVVNVREPRSHALVGPRASAGSPS